MNKKLQVFVSSTYSDLIQERQAAVGAILSAGHIPAGMELFTSGDESQMKVIKRWIDQSDIFLLIVGGRYGSIEPKTGKSYVHLEYEYAIQAGKPLITCVIPENALESRIKEHGLGAIEREHPEKLNEFRKQVLTRMVKFWRTPIEIEKIILTDLATYAGQGDLIGWVRAPINGAGNETPGIRLVTARRRELPKEFHNRKYTTEKFDLLAVAVKDCLRELAFDPENRMVKRILCDGARCQIVFVHPHSEFLRKRAAEDKADEKDVIKLQMDSIKYVVLFYKKLQAFYEQEKDNLDANKFGNVQIRLIDTNPYVTIERFGDEINWGLYTSSDEGKNCAMFTVIDKQDDNQSRVFDQLKHHFYALLDHGEPLLTLTNGELNLKHHILESILTREEVDRLLR